MTEKPEKLDLRSADIAAAQQEKLRQLFPEVFTEGGKVDFDRLKTTLGDIVDGDKERYGMNWPGKSECFKTIQAPSRATLRPNREESVNFDTSENLIIEGDNLEVLKLLQKGYLGQVKMIYIDPPYNTGNDFIYPDNYSENLDTYLSYTGQVDRDGRKYSTNTETEGRFHSKWLNMMYPRLFLARNLLREDGLIFISIDDNEVTNLRRLTDEIFGEENLINVLIWKKRYNAAKEQHLAVIHDYVLIYAKNKVSVGDFLVPGDADYYKEQFTESDEYEATRGKFMTQPLEAGNSMDARPNLRFSIPAPDGSEIWPRRQWVWGRDKVEEARLKGALKIYRGREGDWKVRHKQYAKDENGNFRKVKPFTIFDKCFTQDGTKEIGEVFDGVEVFPFPKPTRLIRHFLDIADDAEGIYLDFFAGSGSTAHAVFKLNNEDRGNRKFILVQLPEPTERKDFPTIADITKERVRRVIRKLNDKKAEKLDLEKGEKTPDYGFRVFKLDTSNFKPWDGTQPDAPEGVSKQLELHVDHVLPDRSQEDILTELLLKSGFALSTKIEALQLAGKQVFSVEEGTMLVCLDGKLTPEVIKAMADQKPSRVICLDDGFQGNDQLKTNAVQTMKARGVLSFRTV